MTIPRFPLTAALAAAVLTLGACGGGSTTVTDDDRDPPPPDDPGTAGLGAILERSNALLLSGQHTRWSLTVDGETIEDSTAEATICSGASCVWADGTETTVRDLTENFAGVDSGGGEATLGMRAGFDTVTTGSGFDVSERLRGVTVTAAPEVISYGFWGEHGFATVTLGAGPLSGQIQGEPFSGEFALATAWMVGDATGTNPPGLGSATWTGIAEAVETGAFERLQGTVTVTVADLSRPRVGVAIGVPGHDIGAPGWADMPLSEGRFGAGTPGGGDWLAGNFHGPDHDEAWGVFDTTDYLGAFGARRAP